MLTREEFDQRFGRRAIFGMVHLAPLPGAPLYAGSMQAIVDAALNDARALAAGGCDGLLFENFGDRPFRKKVEGETIAAMTRVIGEVIREVPLLFGVNVLRNDAHAALAIAAATGGRFVRINIHVGAMITDQGVIEGEAAETLRLRSLLAPDTAIFADYLVKHASPLAPVDEMQMARDLRTRGLSDAIIISGCETGAPADVGRLETVRRAVDAPILIGSGLNERNAATYADADGAIVGSSVKRDGNVEAPVDQQRVEGLVRAFKPLVVR